MIMATRSEQESGGVETVGVQCTNYRGSPHSKTEPGHHFVSGMSKWNEPQMWCKARNSSKHRHGKKYTKQPQEGNGSFVVVRPIDPGTPIDPSTPDTRATDADSLCS